MFTTHKERVTDMKIRIFQRDIKVILIPLAVIAVLFMLNAMLRDILGQTFSNFFFLFSALSLVAAIAFSMIPTTITVYDDSIGIKHIVGEKKIRYENIEDVSVEEYKASRKSGMQYHSEQRVRLIFKIREGDSFSRYELNDSANSSKVDEFFSDKDSVKMDLYWLYEHLKYVISD